MDTPSDVDSVPIPISSSKVPLPNSYNFATEATRQWAGGGNRHTKWYFFEVAPLFQDPPMSDTHWVARNSWLRHLPEPKSLVLLLYTLWPIVAWTTLVSVFVVCYYQFLQVKPGWPVAVSSNYLSIFSLTSFALSLLLVFRVNETYSRWWEARIAFGRFYNCVRNISRMSLAWMENEPEMAAEIVRWTSVLAAAACTFLRDDTQYLTDLAGDILSPAELEWLGSAKQPPIAILQVISATLKRCPSLSVYERCEIEREVATFDVALGATERIRRTSVPLAYNRQTSRFLMAYLSFLPFGLCADYVWLTIPVVIVFTVLLVGIENIGTQLEQPFMVLPLRAMAVGCRTAAESVYYAHNDAKKFAARAASKSKSNLASLQETTQ